jgi:hypothetical protein
MNGFKAHGIVKQNKPTDIRVVMFDAGGVIVWFYEAVK